MLNTLLNFSFNSLDVLTTTTAVEKGYLLTCVTGLYLGLRYTKVTSSLQSRRFFKIATQRYMEEEQERGTEVARKRKKTPASRPYESAKCPLSNCD